MTERAPVHGTRTFTLAIALASMAIGIGALFGAPARAVDPPAAEITGVECAEDCAGTRATAGSELRIEGSRLRGVEEVTLKSTDDGRTEAEITATRPGSVAAVVPDDAASGRLRAVTDDGQRLRAPERLRIAKGGGDSDPDPDDPDPDPEDPDEPGEFALSSVEAKPRKAFYGDGKGARVLFEFDADGPTDVRISVVKRANGNEVDSFVVRDAAPGETNTASWNGRVGKGEVLDSGKFEFVVSAAGSTRSTRASREMSADFDLYPEKFPVRGKHTFGDGFGAGRGHQGADIFASCGTKLVAARGGKVQYHGYQSSAGNYTVIDTRGSGIDQVYMHLKRPAKYADGKRVKTGDVIGRVGETGNASGCHLHFEIWSAPGWYEGGSAESSVMRQVKKWDGWS